MTICPILSNKFSNLMNLYIDNKKELPNIIQLLDSLI